MTPTLIASYFVPSNAQNSTALTTPSFTPATNELLVLKCINADSTAVWATPTATGGAITWLSRVTDYSSSHCGVAIFTGVVTSGGSAITVSCGFTATHNEEHEMVLERWANAKLATTPATVATVSASGTPSASLTTAAAGSVVSWLNGDWNAVSGTSRAYLGSPTEEQYQLSATLMTGYWAYQTAATAGAQTLGLSAPAGQAWSILGIEIQDAGITQVTVDASTVGFPSNVGSSGTAVTWGTYTVPAGATLVAAGFALNSATGVTGWVWSTTTGQTFTQRTLAWDGNTNPLIVSTWHNSSGSSVSVTVQVKLTYTNNKTVGLVVQVVSGDSGSPAIRASLTGSTTLPQLAATPSVVGSMMMLYYGQPLATANASSLVSGSAVDTSPASTAQGNTGTNALAGGIIHQSAVNAQTASPVTVGAGAPSATTYAVLMEFTPPGGGTPTGWPNEGWS